jgi:protein tyrosine phosphatase (PTP) superfamily phosphohydrolase (DUF442 family)
VQRYSCVGLALVIAGCGERPTPPAGRAVAVRPVNAPGLSNVFRVSDRIYSGSSPDGDAGFAALHELGIKTIITVDGSTPDVATAHRHGLAYVHLPVGYDGIPRDKVLALARAAAELPGPIYVHCHHGQHRGPAAVAVIQLCTDPAWDPAAAEAWLRTAGTDPRYTGLVSIPRTLVRPSAEELAGVAADFPEVAPARGLTQLMVEVDSRWDRLTRVKAAGWGVPADRPDVDPPHEAVQLGEQFREAARLDAVRRRGPEFARRLGEAEAAAIELERGLQSPVDAVRAAKAFERSAAACAACHERFRDRPGG